jgi:uncharacterized protein (TIGR01440 family)
MFDVTEIKKQVNDAVKELLDLAQLSQGSIFVIGCSTSEVVGKKIGSASNNSVAEAIFDGAMPLIQENGLFLAIQCCEHLNRALVVEKKCADKYGLEIVSVIPQENAGGSLATFAYSKLNKPVLVEKITAHAGIDIGDTFIGMHLKPVAVPVRLATDCIGKAHLTLARIRPKLIGGARAKY